MSCGSRCGLVDPPKRVGTVETKAGREHSPPVQWVELERASADIDNAH